MTQQLQRRTDTSASPKARRPVADAPRRLGDDAVVALRSVGPRAGAMGSLSPREVLHLQRTVGNRAASQLVGSRRPVALVVQREMTDNGKTGEDLAGYVRGPAEKAETAAPVIERVNGFGDIDGEITSTVAPHAFNDGGRTGESTWHHCGGGGGKGDQNTGAATLVAPVYKTKPPGKSGQAKAWIKKGTGTVKVTRSYKGVTKGPQGSYTQPPVGSVYMSTRARTRVDKHEREHTKKTKEIHDTHIKPLEARISTYQGYIKAKKKGATAAQALTALQTEIDWNASVQSFANDDTAQNYPMGPVDQSDMNQANFYADYTTSAKFRQKSNCTIYEGVGASNRGKT